MIEAISAMNFFDLAGQNLRVGKAITPPNCFDSTPNIPTSLPTAAAIAAAAATAKIQAMDAAAASVTTTNIHPSGFSSFGSQPVTAQTAPGLITGVTVIPPPSVISLPLAIKNGGTNGTNSNDSISESTLNENVNGNSTIMINNEKVTDSKASNQEEQVPKEEEAQTLQQQENVVIKGTNARQVLMHKLMRKNEVSYFNLFFNLKLLNKII